MDNHVKAALIDIPGFINRCSTFRLADVLVVAQEGFPQRLPRERNTVCVGGCEQWATGFQDAIRVFWGIRQARQDKRLVGCFSFICNSN